MFKNNGFSLIELMTVILIIGILIGIAVPTINRNIPYRRLLNGTSQVKSDLSLMRQKSLMEMSSYGLLINISSPNQYILYQDRNGNGSFDIGTDRQVTIRNLPGNVRFVSNTNININFLRNGILNSNSNFNLLLQNNRDEQKALTIMLSGVVVD